MSSNKWFLLQVLILAITMDYLASAAPTTNYTTKLDQKATQQGFHKEPKFRTTSWRHDLNKQMRRIYGGRCTTKLNQKARDLMDFKGYTKQASQCSFISYCKDGGSCMVNWLYAIVAVVVAVIMIWIFVLFPCCCLWEILCCCRVC
jgi:hypothetical protein